MAPGAEADEVVTDQPQQEQGLPPPPGAPTGGEWEGEPYCGKKSLIVGLVLHCWCVVFCPIDTRPVYMAEGRKYNRQGAIKFDAGIYDEEYGN